MNILMVVFSILLNGQPSYDLAEFPDKAQCVAAKTAMEKDVPPGIKSYAIECIELHVKTAGPVV